MNVTQTVEHLSSLVGDLYDEDGIKTDPRSIRAIKSIQNLQDNIQFLNILNFSSFDKYWYIKVEHSKYYDDGYSQYMFRFEHDNNDYRNITQEIIMSSTDRIKKYLYHVNQRCLQEDDYCNFIRSVFADFNRTLDQSAYVNYLQSNELFRVEDYYINNKPLIYNRSIEFRCYVDLDIINGESSNNPTNIVAVECTFLENHAITLTFSLPDLIIDNNTYPQRRTQTARRVSIKRDSIEDKTVAKAVEDFYLKLLFNILSNNLYSLVH